MLFIFSVVELKLYVEYIFLNASNASLSEVGFNISWFNHLAVYIRKAYFLEFLAFQGGDDRWGKCIFFLILLGLPYPPNLNYINHLSSICLSSNIWFDEKAELVMLCWKGTEEYET